HFCVPETARERRLFRFAFGNGVAVRLLDHLNFVLDLTEESVGATEALPLASRYEAAVRQTRKSAERVGIAHLRVVAAVQELQRLREEFHFADAAATQLDIPRLVRRPQQLALDAALHLAQLLDRAEVEIASVNKRFDFAQKVLAEGDVAGGGPRFDERGSLPRLTPRFVVHERGSGRLHDRPLAAEGSKPQIGAEDEAAGGDLAHCPRDRLGNAREKLARRELAFDAPGAFAFVFL